MTGFPDLVSEFVRNEDNRIALEWRFMVSSLTIRLWAIGLTIPNPGLEQQIIEFIATRSPL